MSKYTVKESDDRVERDVADVFREESKGRRISTSGRASRRKGFKGAVKFPSDITTDKAYKRPGDVLQFQLGHLAPEELREMLQNSPSVRKLVAERIERETHTLQEGLSYAVGIAVGPLVTEVAAALRLLAGQVDQLQQQVNALRAMPMRRAAPDGRVADDGASWSGEPRRAAAGTAGSIVSTESGARRRRRTRRDWSDPDVVIFSSLARLQRDGIEIERATEVLAHDSTVYQRALKRYGRWKNVLAAFYRRVEIPPAAEPADSAARRMAESDAKPVDKTEGAEGAEPDLWEAIERERRALQAAVGADV